MEKTPTGKNKFLPYGRQHIFENDIEAVISVLKSDWITQGPRVPAFEKALTETLGARSAVACANGTAALHLCTMALGIGPGDVIVTTPISFLSSANCGRFVGAEVRFVDIEPQTALMDIEELKRILSEDTAHKIKAIVPVHFGGQPLNLPEIYKMALAHGAQVIDDACHAIGGTYSYDDASFRIGDGNFTDLTVFSFHPVKHIAMGEGGAITTNNEELAEKMRLLRTHDIHKEGLINEDMAYAPNGEVNPWYYEMHDLGYNYRLTDFQAALGLGQIARLDWSLKRRREIADLYRKLISEKFTRDEVSPLSTVKGTEHAYHLFVVQIDFDSIGTSRAEVMNYLRRRDIGTQVHYIPIHLQPYYRRHSGTRPGDFPNAEKYYEKALSLPMYPDLTDDDVTRVVAELAAALKND